jgi:hypothetical protein
VFAPNVPVAWKCRLPKNDGYGAVARSPDGGHQRTTGTQNPGLPFFGPMRWAARRVAHYGGGGPGSGVNMKSAGAMILVAGGCLSRALFVGRLSGV